jgi:putative endonuclease
MASQRAHPTNKRRMSTEARKREGGLASDPSLGIQATVRHQQVHRVHVTDRRRMSTEARPASVPRAKVDRHTVASLSAARPSGVKTRGSLFVSHSNSLTRIWRYSCGKTLAQGTRVLKRFVYVLRNHESPPQYYTGVTSDVTRRCAEHNAGSCIHTAKHRPWSVDVVIEFADERRALTFERYLKSGSGVAFAHRHLR